MASTRTRLTISYLVVLTVTLVAFSVALYVARLAEADQDVLQQAVALADDVLATIRNAQLAGKELTYIEQAPSGPPLIRASQEMGKALDRHAGYFVVLDSLGRLLYSSNAVRLLGAEDQQEILTVAFQLRAGGDAARVPLTSDSLLKGGLMLVARRDPSIGTNISRVVGGLPTDLANVAPHLLLGTLLALAPVILIISLGVAYFVAGRAFRPVDALINEVEAITDGRSLHRRLPVATSGDELARLSATLNAMIARLESSFTALRRFTADASHELKTPLTVLRADVERAMHPGTVTADRMVALEEALQETARMSDLVNSLLTLARADEGRFDLHRTPVELEPLLREVYETATILGEDAELTLSLAAMENGVVMGDRTRLRQLFLNLVTNAIKYTPRGGHVELSATKRAADEISIGVRDTGIGIAAADLPHVFDRFWRADRVRSRAAERGGFGLGLSISQWIVQAHGGTIAVQSRLGRGTIFTVVLPIVPSEAPADQAAQPTPAAQETESATESAES